MNMPTCNSCKSCDSCKLIRSSCNETVDINAVFIKKNARRDTHQLVNYRDYDLKKNYCGQQEIICLREYCLTIGALPTIAYDYTAKKTNKQKQQQTKLSFSRMTD